jgi:hypothetical protein
MKPKKPTNQSGRRGGLARSRPSSASSGSVIINFIQRRIEAYNNELGGGVAVRKNRDGYTLIRQDTGSPLARLRPITSEGSFAVLCWNKSSGRWRPVGEWGVSFPSLDEALDFIASDPLDCFWS